MLSKLVVYRNNHSNIQTHILQIFFFGKMLFRNVNMSFKVYLNQRRYICPQNNSCNKCLHLSSRNISVIHQGAQPNDISLLGTLSSIGEGWGRGYNRNITDHRIIPSTLHCFTFCFLIALHCMRRLHSIVHVNTIMCVYFQLHNNLLCSMCFMQAIHEQSVVFVTVMDHIKKTIHK